MRSMRFRGLCRMAQLWRFDPDERPNRVAREVALPSPHNTPQAGPHGAFHEGEEREILLPQGWRYDTTPSGLFPWRGYLLQREVGLLCRSCSSPRNAVAGFLQTPPPGDTLALERKGPGAA